MPDAPFRWSRPSRLAITTTAALALAGVIGPAAAESATSHTQTYSTPGLYSFAVPADVTHITISATGAAGGSCYPGTTLGASGGDGAHVLATVAVTPGSHLIVGVGGAGGACTAGGTGGTNGGAQGGSAYGTTDRGGGGGGASGVLVSATLPLVVAGGGGGAGYCAGNGGNADAAGTTPPPCPHFAGASGSGGGAGTVTAGGTGGAAGSANATAGAPGTTEFGGAGGDGDSTGPSAGGGGGGGGVHGGGGGGGGGVYSGSGGGGGGASFVTPKATAITAPAPTSSPAQVTITYQAAPAPRATTRKAGRVKTTSATLHGSVNGNGLSTTYWFQWGTSKHYGHKTSARQLKASSAGKSVSALLRRLKPGSRYHFRLVARTASGTTYGKDMTFRTRANKPAFTG
ncbi:MAG TPA: hypothetical protein VFP55_02010 [Solirubrobacteraceae bacterium]|nr:hypothetical protein [Solirubrobacteraceae bacterium]